MKLNLHTTLILAAFVLLLPLVGIAQERIAFQSFRDGNNEVYSMRADGSNPLRLTNNPAFDGEPSFSGDGSKIAFTSTRDGANNGEIYVMNADGTNQTRLTYSLGSDAHPSFSFDGSKITFISDRAGNLEIFVMNSDGSDQRRLTFNDYNDFSPSFSPDGTKIIYGGFDGNDPEIYIVSVAGGDPVNLTDNTRDDRDPVFSPDGTKIAYQVYDVFEWDVFTMNADGTNRVNLTDSPNVSEDEPSWSPDGNHIVFDREGEVYAMTYGGVGQTNLTNNAASDTRPTWAPSNSSPILENIAVANVNEGDVARLTGTINDANPGDSFTMVVSWGEGGPAEEHEFPAGTTDFELTHVYEDDAASSNPSDTYQVIANVNDHRFGVDIKDTTVTVNNVNPTISNLALNPSTAPLGTNLRLTGNFDDAGYHGSVADESLVVTINWGDGQTNLSIPAAPGVIDIFHTYPAIGNYTITVKVTDNDQGVTIQTIPVTVAPPPAPAAPTNFRIDYIGANRVQLAWTDASTNETGFVVERCANRGCSNFAQVGQVGANTTVYLDTNLFANTQYYYRVKAINLGGSSAYSDVVSAKTLKK